MWLSREEILRRHNLPPKSTILGYIVCFPDSDEFLHSFELTEGICKGQMAPIPHFAKIFDDYMMAHSVSILFPQKAVVGLLIDAIAYYAVACEKSFAEWRW